MPRAELRDAHAELAHARPAGGRVDRLAPEAAGEDRVVRIDSSRRQGAELVRGPLSTTERLLCHACQGAPVTAGLGLNAIAARVGQLGGTWRLQDAPAGGARMLVCVPFDVDGEYQAAGAAASGPRLEQVEHSLG